MQRNCNLCRLTRAVQHVANRHVAIKAKFHYAS